MASKFGGIAIEQPASKFGGVPVEHPQISSVSTPGQQITPEFETLLTEISAGAEQQGKPISTTAFNPEQAKRFEPMGERKKFDPAFRRQAQEASKGLTGALRTGAIQTGAGLAKIGRAIGIGEPLTEVEKTALEALEQQRPVISGAGEIIGESLPFAAVPVGGIASVPARVVASTALGATEGALVRRGEGADIGEQAETAGLAGLAAGTVESIIPIVGKIGAKLIRKATGKAPVSEVITKTGAPTEELATALKKTGVNFEDIVDGAKELSGKSTPEAQQIRQALFDQLGIPATKGDITQDFAQQATEARLIESAADPLSDPLRTRVLEKSEALTGNIQDIIDKAGLPENIGKTMKDALEGRKDLLKAEKNALYTTAAKNAKNPELLPFPIAAISDAMPDERTLRGIKTQKSGETEELLNVLAEFGIDNSKAAKKRLKDKKIKKIPLSVSTFDLFRQSLNNLTKVAPGEPNHMEVIVGPIRRALDNEADSLSATFKKAGIEDDVIEPLKEARETVRQLKTEFSPQSITGKLIGVKRDGITPLVESSNVFKNVVGTNQPIELLERTVTSLKKAGPKGVKAIGDLQAATVLDLMESAFKAEGRKVKGSKVFGTIPFTKRYNQIGEDKLKLIFSTKPELLKELKKVNQAAKDLTPPSGALPKGSASVILDTMRKIGLLTILGRVPGGGLLAEGVTRLAEGSTTRKAVETALKADIPKIKQNTATVLDQIVPSLVAAITADRTEKE